MKSHKLEKYAACLLVAVLSMVFGAVDAFSAPAEVIRPGANLADAPNGSGQPTCLC